MQKIRIMISSRIKTQVFDGESPISLSAVRTKLKETLEAEEINSNRIYEVWISEEPVDASALESSWDESMAQVEKSDIFLCIYTGEGGWSKADGDIGICHAELETAINKEPSKVYIINATDALAQPIDKSEPKNARMSDYVLKVNRFYSPATSSNEIQNAANQIVAEATVNLAKMGRREARKGKYNFGEALDWTRMSFHERKAAIEDEIASQFAESGHAAKDASVEYRFGRKKYLFVIHGIPSGMSVSSAREMVGQPFLEDHDFISAASSGLHGPVHIIGVHKGVSEQNAITTLGHPDAVVVKGSYGVYIADRIQNVQLVFLAQCRDSASTRNNVQKFIAWLQESDEDSSFYIRAERRTEILKVVLRQQES